MCVDAHQMHCPMDDGTDNCTYCRVSLTGCSAFGKYVCFRASECAACVEWCILNATAEALSKGRWYRKVYILYIEYPNMGVMHLACVCFRAVSQPAVYSDKRKAVCWLSRGFRQCRYSDKRSMPTSGRQFVNYHGDSASKGEEWNEFTFNVWRDSRK